MTGMRPWLEEGADEEIAELLAAGRPAVALDDVVRERSRRRMEALERPRRRLGAVEALPAAAGVLMWVQHAALGAGLGVAVVMATAAPRLIRDYSAKTPPPSSAQPAPKRTQRPHVANPVAAPTAPASEEPALAAPPASGSVVAFPEPSTHGDEFELELLLIERAKAELKTNPEVALGTLRTHRTDFANGKLALEREFLTVTALVRLGRLVEARAYADALRKRAPGNLYDERLRKLLGDPAHAP